MLGNNDAGLSFKETEVVQLAGRKFLVHHIVDVHRPSETLQRRITRERPDVVVFGHSHKPFNEAIGGTLYFNPGYAGKPPLRPAALRGDSALRRKGNPAGVSRIVS